MDNNGPTKFVRLVYNSQKDPVVFDEMEWEKVRRLVHALEILSSGKFA
jgi:hypothetical protein